MTDDEWKPGKSDDDSGIYDVRECVALIAVKLVPCQDCTIDKFCAKGAQPHGMLMVVADGGEPPGAEHVPVEMVIQGLLGAISEIGQQGGLNIAMGTPEMFREAFAQQDAAANPFGTPMGFGGKGK